AAFLRRLSQGDPDAADGDALRRAAPDFAGAAADAQGPRLLRPARGGNPFLAFDVRVRTVAAGRGLGVPLPVRSLVLDHLGAAGRALLGGGAPRGGEGRGMRPERFGKNAVDGIGPAAVVLDDLVGDVAHREPARTKVNPACILGQNGAPM